MSILNNSNKKEIFTSLINNIKNDLYNIAKNKIDNINDIDDVIQETVIKAYKNFGSLKNRKYFKTWIIKILLNECNKNYNDKNKEVLLLKKIICKEELNSEDSSISDLEANLHFKDLLNNLLQEIIISIQTPLMQF